MPNFHTINTFSCRVDLTFYTEEVTAAAVESIKAELEPVFADMESKARELCPVGTKERGPREYIRNNRLYISQVVEGRWRKRFGRHRTVGRIITGSKKGFIYKLDYKNTKKLDGPGDSWTSRQPGRLRASIRASVYARKDGTGVVAFLEAGNHDAWYAGYVEYGTYKMKPQPYLRPAFAMHKHRIEMAIARAFRNLRLRGAA